MNIYTVRDSKLEAYLAPFFAVNDALAIRMMEDTAADPQTSFSKHPEDFQIFFIGVYDEKAGEIIPASHKSLGKVIDIKRVDNEN